MRWSIVIFAAIQFFSGQAAAQDYPSKPVRVIVPFAPGGVADIIGRLLGQRLTESTGQTFYVENRPGAGGVIGTELLSKAAADGYSIIIQDMAYTISPSVYSKIPYDPLKDFTPVSLVARTPQWLFISSGVPAKNARDFVALAKRDPSKYTIGSSGNGTGTHLMAELLMRRAGIRLTHVPYKGSGPAVAATSTGEVTAVFTFMPVATPFVQSGRLRPVAVTTENRHPGYPAVPTFEESGITDMVVHHWLGVMAPAGLPGPVLEKLNKAVAQAVHHPSTVERYKTIALEPISSSPEEFRALVESDLKRWASVVKEANIRVE